MPCIKCSNGKCKYVERGSCQFTTPESCQAAEAAIHIRDNPKKELNQTKGDCGCGGGCANCDCQDCKNKLLED